MARCEIIPFEGSKACSGRCSTAVCPKTQGVWVIAACEGMVALFEQQASGALRPLIHKGEAIFATLGNFQRAMTQADETHAFEQLVIIGSAGDVAWVHASLPSPVACRIAAEIEYPLLPAWFRQSLPLPQLKQALQSVFAD